MNLGKFALATFVSAIAMIVLAALWHDVIMGDYYALHSAVMREERQDLFVFLGMFLLALLMAYVYPRGAGEGSALSGGARFGAVMGFIYVLPHGLVLHGVYETLTTELLLVDALWHVVEQGVGGVVIALIFASGDAEDEL